MDPASQLYKSLATEERSFEDDPGAIFLGVLWGPLRLHLPSACRGKGYFGTFWECLNSLSSLPVKEKAISGSGQEASERSFSEDPGHQLWPLAIAFSRCLSTKRLFQSSLGMLAMAFPTCLSKKR